MEPELNGRIFQINTSDGGVPKLARQQAEVTSLGLVGDRQRELHVHGGPLRAVCLYDLTQILALQAEGHPVFPGAMGENITLTGLDWAKIIPGVRLRLGDEVLVEVTRYTTPCNNLRPYFMGENYGRVSQTRHPGWSRVYAAVLQTGKIRVGDAAVLEPVPDASGPELNPEAF